MFDILFVVKLVLDRVEDPVTILSYVSGMYGWIVDGIASLFELVTGQNHTEWSGKGNVSQDIPKRPGVEEQRHESLIRPAKRNYQSVDVADGVCQSDQVEVKRNRRDVVISFVKKTVAGVAGLLRLRNRGRPPVTLIGIDELQTSWLNRTDGANLSAVLSDRGKDRERRASLQLLPSRPAQRVGTTNPDPTCNSFGHTRCYKPILTVEEDIKQYNKEHYRRCWRGWGSLTLSKTFSGAFEDTQPVRCAKPVLQQKQAADLDLSTEVATRLNLVDRETPAVSLPDSHPAHTAHTRHSDGDIPRLTKEMSAEVSCALAQSDPNLRCSGEAAGLKIYSFSTFFFPKLRGGGGGQAGGHMAVRRWTKAVDLFLYDLLLVPLHLGVHWAMAVSPNNKDFEGFLPRSYSSFLVGDSCQTAPDVIDLKSKTVKSYDSMGHRHDDICGLLLHYLKEEHKVKKGRELEGTKWSVGSLRATEIPQQKNGSDCGVFACKYADYIAKGSPLTFKQCHMPIFRKVMIWEILNQKLL
ncbi:hypothetical protein F7725_008200 [Dissostichus mawsoni]|uniref:Ubiquitin-like protease family profile domain-containing protein n=1 Tax=Dissostichus mawsoni TaxID=36200 RepID=A0A7J5Y8Y5_DISMA|nr:hypothetical protein F7725_008200 [Dissostichus mawsoni]